MCTHSPALNPKRELKAGTNTRWLILAKSDKTSQTFNGSIQRYEQKIREGEDSHMKKKYTQRKSYEHRQLLCTSQWLSLKFVSLLIFSQLDACFSGPLSSDLTSDTGGPFGCLETVKVPQESNTVAYCQDQRHTGKPDEDTATYNCHLKGGLHIRGFYFVSAGRYWFAVPSASIRIKEKDKRTGIWRFNQARPKESFGQRVQTKVRFKEFVSQRTWGEKR